MPAKAALELLRARDRAGGHQLGARHHRRGRRAGRPRAVIRQYAFLLDKARLQPEVDRRPA
jgi:ribosomal protein S14